MSWNVGSVIANGGDLAPVPSLSSGESRGDEPKQGSARDMGRSGAIRSIHENPHVEREPFVHFWRENSPALAP